jgi:hypothetical protein
MGRLSAGLAKPPQRIFGIADGRLYALADFPLRALADFRLNTLTDGKA